MPFSLHLAIIKCISKIRSVPCKCKNHMYKASAHTCNNWKLRFQQAPSNKSLLYSRVWRCRSSYACICSYSRSVKTLTVFTSTSTTTVEAPLSNYIHAEIEREISQHKATSISVSLSWPTWSLFQLPLSPLLMQVFHTGGATLHIYFTFHISLQHPDTRNCCGRLSPVALNALRSTRASKRQTRTGRSELNCCYKALWTHSTSSDLAHRLEHHTHDLQIMSTNQVNCLQRASIEEHSARLLGFVT